MTHLVHTMALCLLNILRLIYFPDIHSMYYIRYGYRNTNSSMILIILIDFILLGNVLLLNSASNIKVTYDVYTT